MDILFLILLKFLWITIFCLININLIFYCEFVSKHYLILWLQSPILNLVNVIPPSWYQFTLPRKSFCEKLFFSKFIIQGYLFLKIFFYPFLIKYHKEDQTIFQVEPVGLTNHFSNRWWTITIFIIHYNNFSKV